MVGVVGTSPPPPLPPRRALLRPGLDNMSEGAGTVVIIVFFAEEEDAAVAAAVGVDELGNSALVSGGGAFRLYFGEALEVVILLLPLLPVGVVE